jgi:protein O-mannosyl-transferase
MRPEQRHVFLHSSFHAIKSPHYWLALALFACCLLSKPALVTIPLGMLLLDYWPLQRLQFPMTRSAGSETKDNLPMIRGLILEKVPFFALGVMDSVVTVWVHHASGAMPGLKTLPLVARIENMFVSYARYLGKTLWPADLALPYPHPGQWPVSLVVLGFVLILGLSYTAVRLGRRHPYAFTRWFWFVAMLILVIGLVQ